MFFHFFIEIIARTKALLDHFEGDIGSVVLVKKRIEMTKVEPIVKCKKACDEYIEMNMVGNENYLVRKTYFVSSNVNFQFVLNPRKIPSEKS